MKMNVVLKFNLKNKKNGHLVASEPRIEASKPKKRSGTLQPYNLFKALPNQNNRPRKLENKRSKQFTMMPTYPRK